MKFHNLMYNGPINDDFVSRLHARLSQAPKDSTGCRLIFSTKGGKITAGFKTLSVLHESRLALHTAASGPIESVGILLFSAGQRRICETSAMFRFHPVQLGDGELQLSLSQLKEIRKGGLAVCSDEVLHACMKLGLCKSGVLDSDAVNKSIASMEYDSRRLMRAISKNTGISSCRIAAAMKKSRTWSARRAVKMGLANEYVKTIEITPGELIHII